MKFIWAKDGWTTKCSMPDKLEHFNAGFMGTIALLLVFKAWWVIPVALVAAVLWEVKDAIYNPWNFPAKARKTMGVALRGLLRATPNSDLSRALSRHARATFPWHWLWGDGFSWRDMLASWVGVLVAWGLAHIGGVI